MGDRRQNVFEQGSIVSAERFFRAAIESGQQDEFFGDEALARLTSNLETVAQEIRGADDDNSFARLLLSHASAAIRYLADQINQDNEVIAALSVDLDRARAEAKGEVDDEGQGTK